MIATNQVTIMSSMQNKHVQQSDSGCLSGSLLIVSTDTCTATPNFLTCAPCYCETSCGQTRWNTTLSRSFRLAIASKPPLLSRPIVAFRSTLFRELNEVVSATTCISMESHCSTQWTQPKDTPPRQSFSIPVLEKPPKH